MKKSLTDRCCLPILVVAFAILLGTGACGGNNRRLESITIVGQGGSSVEGIIHASGTFTTPPTLESQLDVSWYLMGPGLDPPPAAYTLTPGSFVLPCGGYTAIAVAPSNPNAPISGSIPQAAFQDLVITRTKSSEGGFVAAFIVSQSRC